LTAEEISKLARSGKLEIVTNSSILHGDKGEITTLWANPLRQHQFQNANYIEATFRIVAENKTSNDAGIMWNDGNKEYTASVRNDRLEILVKPIDFSSTKEPSEKKLAYVREIKRENGVWYTLKVITMEDYVNVYIDDLLAAKLPRSGNQSYSQHYQQDAGIVTPTEKRTSSNDYPAISVVGLFSFNNIAEFKPIEIGQVPLQLYEKKGVYFEHYYPLNMLSLSKLNYETFLEGDLSVFSKKIIVLDMASFRHSYSSTMNSTDGILSTNPKDSNLYTKHKAIDNNNNTDNKFLEFAKKGGTLIITNIVNSDSNYFPNQDILQNTELGDLFSIQAGDKIKFDKIAQNNAGNLSKTKKLETPQHSIHVSGVAQDVKLKNKSSSVSDFKVTSFYMRDNNEVAPFALEKKYGTGKIIVVNSGDYFDAISSSPKQYFKTLAEIPSLLVLDAVSHNNNNVVTDNTLSPNVIPIARFVGDLKVSDHSLINSSSLSIFANKTTDSAYSFYNDKFHAQSISESGIEDDNNSDIPDTKHILHNNNYTISDAVIRDLKLAGGYEVLITLNGSLVLPSMLTSYYDYVAASIPTGFNMIIKLHDGATAEFIAENGQHGQPVRFIGKTKINFYNVSDLQDEKDISVLLKSPEIRVVNGRANFEKLFMYDPYSKIGTYGGPLDVKGSMIAKFGHVDNYNEIDSNGGWINSEYITYLKSIHFGKNDIYNNDKKINLKFPADISALAKEEGVLVPWQKALLSDTNIVISLSIVVAVTLTILWLPRRLVLK
jgi:hypothetical protein